MRFAVLLLLLLSGCHSVKHEWFPEPRPEAHREAEFGRVIVNVVKVRL